MDDNGIYKFYNVPGADQSQQYGRGRQGLILNADTNNDSKVTLLSLAFLSSGMAGGPCRRQPRLLFRSLRSQIVPATDALQVASRD